MLVPCFKSYPTSEPLKACNGKRFLSESYQPVEGLAETAGQYCKKLMHISLHAEQFHERKFSYSSILYLMANVD